MDHNHGFQAVLLDDTVPGKEMSARLVMAVINHRGAVEVLHLVHLWQRARDSVGDGGAVEGRGQRHVGRVEGVGEVGADGERLPVDEELGAARQLFAEVLVGGNHRGAARDGLVVRQRLARVRGGRVGALDAADDGAVVAAVVVHAAQVVDLRVARVAEDFVRVPRREDARVGADVKPDGSPFKSSR
jgi:hypothetical protein